VKKLVKIMVMNMVIAAVLVLSITGTVFAAGGQSGNGNRGEDCPYGDCTNEDCELKAYSSNYSYEYEAPGPHGMQNMVKNGAQTSAGNGVQNQCQKGKFIE
jgi:hypothetical protein